MISVRNRIRAIMLAPLVLMLGVAMLGSSASAQDATPVTGGVATVTVQGFGSVNVAPDAAQATVGVQISEATLSGALETASTQMTAVIDALKAAGIADEDIQTTGFWVNVMQNYDEQGNPLDVIGYQVSNQVTVTIRPPDQVGAILDAAVTAGANTIYGVMFFVENPGEAGNDARREAYTDAEARAQVLANAAGKSLGNIVSISESFGTIAYSEPAAQDAGMAKGGAGPIEAGSNTITSNLIVAWELV